MAKKKQTSIGTIPSYIPVRDELMVALINGATKPGFAKDRKKEANRNACRGKPSKDD